MDAVRRCANPRVIVGKAVWWCRSDFEAGKGLEAVVAATFVDE